MGAYLSWDNAGSSMQLDVVTSEMHEHANDVTEHPVEEGANVIDHIRPQLNKVTLEGRVSNEPVVSLDAVQDRIVLQLPQPPPQHNIGGVIGLLSSQPAVVANVQTFPNGPTDYVTVAFATLELLRSSGTIVSVVCRNAFYSSMAIQSFSMHREQGTGTGADFTIELVEIRTVTSASTDAPQPTIPRATPEKPKGAQSTEEAGIKKSALTSLLGHFGLGF